MPGQRILITSGIISLLATSPLALPPDVASASGSSGSPRAVATQLPFPSALTNEQQCLSQIGTANASNTVSSLETLDIKSEETAHKQHQIALSLTIGAPAAVDNSSIQINSTVWLGIDKAMDYTNTTLPFSACALVFNNLSDMATGRGASPDRSCEQTFSEECVTDLQDQAAEMAWDFSKNTSQAEPRKGMFSELPEICNFVADQMTIALPDSCRNFASNNRLWESVDTLPITGEKPLGLTGCNISADLFYQAAPYKAYNTFPIHQSTLTPPTNASIASGPGKLGYDLYYQRVVQSVVPVMRVYMPTVNSNTSPAFVKIESAKAEMTCLKASVGRDEDGSLHGLPTSKTSDSTTPKVQAGAMAGLGLLSVALAMCLV